MLVGAVTIFTLRESLTSQINAGLASEAEGIHQRLEAELSEREKNVESWAEDAIVRGALIYNSYDKSDSSLDVLRRRYPQFVALVLFTPNGRAVSASDRGIRDRYAAQTGEVARSPWFTAALQSQRAHGDVQADAVLDANVLHFARPVINPAEDRVIGVLMAAYDWTGRMQETVAPVLARAEQRGHRTLGVVMARAEGILYQSEKRALLSDRDVEALLARQAEADVVPIGDRVAAFTRNTSGNRSGWLFGAVLDQAEAYAPVRRTMWITVGLVLMFGAACVIFSFLLSRRLVRPITALNAVVERIVREGDLTHPIHVESHDEIGQLAGTFAKMVDKLREIPASLQESTRLLTDSVSHLTASTQEQHKTISRQAAALQEAQVTMQEIKQTSLLAAQKSETVLRVAERADQIGRDGEAAIERSLSGLSDIRVQATEIADKITSLTDRTRQIGLITETVKDLADQSNMLALNAAIEAVRSGQHGKGFAVVAREIRSLADQSIQATNRVREILDDISTAIRGAVSITEKGAEKMEGGLVQVRASGESLQELSSIVTENSGAVRQIAAAVSQQNAGIAQISAAVSELNELMQDTVTRLNATNEAASMLKEVAERVSSIVASYRI
ncbi:MAG TPA: methyl-accepting chemotaxis protein [Polyangiaceae bacterium]|nr:methyl-accepting chemotaxis protein [Polyangiaceae bacterium]